VFPAAQLGGPAFVRALAAVFPALGFLPTGGVDEESLRSYLEIDAVVAVAGTWIVPRDLVAARDFAGVTRLARAAAEAAGRS
jgi:2-dehydro-3-deoxyphosphogluconate aldolase/(4S)-4-hydroxy-2-oxoglutarate aldolase